MSFYDYTVSRYLVGTPFEALIMAAMRGADTTNLALLREAWPDVWNELEARHNAPGGVLDGDPEYVKAQARAREWDSRLAALREAMASASEHSAEDGG